MREMMTQAGLEPPLFESVRSDDKFVARYYFQHFLSEEAIRWLSRFRELALSDEEADALFPKGYEKVKPYLRITPQPNR